MPEDKLFEITEKGEKLIEKLQTSSETTQGDLQLAFLLTANSGNLVRDHITTRYGTIGSPVIKKLKKSGYIK